MKVSKRKIVNISMVVIAISIFVAITLMIVSAFRSSTVLTETSVSPSERWKVKLYNVVPGAMASTSYYIEITDLKNKLPIREIALIKKQLKFESNINWKNTNAIVVFGQEINVRNGTVRFGSSTSPKNKWRVQLYKVGFGSRWKSPEYYVNVTNLKGKAPARKIRLEPRKLLEDDISWESANIVNIYGQEVNVSTGRLLLSRDSEDDWSEN